MEQWWGAQEKAGVLPLVSVENELFSAKDVKEEMLASVLKNQSGCLCSVAEAAKGTRKARETISLTFKWWVNEKGSIWV